MSRRVLTLISTLTLLFSIEGPEYASTHAAGVVIGDRPLDELVPLYQDPRSDMPATQFNMKWVEQAGLVKFDFLGLKTLTVLDKGVKLLAQRGVEVDMAAFVSVSDWSAHRDQIMLIVHLGGTSPQE